MYFDVLVLTYEAGPCASVKDLSWDRKNLSWNPKNLSWCKNQDEKTQLKKFLPAFSRKKPNMVILQIFFFKFPFFW